MHGMTRRLPVPADLQPWIEQAVVVHAGAGLACSRFPALASSQLVLRLAGEVSTPDGRVLPAAAVLGPNPQPAAFHHRGAVHAVGLVLRPQAAAVLLRCDGAELTGAPRDLADLPGAPGHGLLDAAAHAADDAARLAGLFDWVRGRVQGTAAQRQLARRQQMAHAVMAGLDSAHQQLGWSRRQLQRRFVQDFGLPPKPFQTLLRLQAALHDGLSGRLDGAALALAHGYYDQSHLARALRRLAGEPLAGLRPHALAQRPEHWALQLALQPALS